MTRDELLRRLDARIDDGFCRVADGSTVVYEDTVGGEARVTCTLPEGAVVLVFRLDTIGFPFLRQKTSVDWLLLVHLADDSLDAHMIECKRKVNPSKWGEVKRQMASSVTRARTLAGVLGVEVRRFFGYTAYRIDDLSGRGAPDPVFTRVPLGPGEVAREEPPDTREARAAQFDWEAGEIRVEGMPVPHRRVQLDQGSGAGQVTLAGPAR